MALVSFEGRCEDVSGFCLGHVFGNALFVRLFFGDGFGYGCGMSLVDDVEGVFLVMLGLSWECL